MATMELFPAKLLKKVGVFNPGEVAGFIREVLSQLVRAGAAEPVKVAAPAKKPSGKADDAK